MGFVEGKGQKTQSFAFLSGLGYTRKQAGSARQPDQQFFFGNNTLIIQDVFINSFFAAPFASEKGMGIAKMIKINKIFSLPALIALFSILAAGCANNVVSLKYVATGPTLQNTGKTVIVQELVDQRSITELGRRDNGDYFAADVRVSDWVSRALADEFTRQGVNVSYTGEGYMALSAPTISGTVDTLWLEETGTTSFVADMKITLQLHDSTGKFIYQESFWCKQTARFMPNDSNISELMTDTLRDLVAPAAQAMGKRL